METTEVVDGGSSDLLPAPASSGHALPRSTLWKPGQSGNPSGRVAGSFSIRSALRAQLAANGLAGDMARAMLQAAREGDKDRVWCLATLIAEAEGKPREHIEHSVATRYVVDLDDAAQPPPSLPGPPAGVGTGGGVAPPAYGSDEAKNVIPPHTQPTPPLPLPGTPIPTLVERMGPPVGTPEVDP